MEVNYFQISLIDVTFIFNMFVRGANKKPNIIGTGG